MSDSDQNQQSLPTPGDIAHDRASEFQVAQREKGFVDREMERREKAKQDGDSGGDQEEVAKARILPNEQHERGPGRGR